MGVATLIRQATRRPLTPLVFDPSILDLSLWLRAPFATVPWSGKSSVGTSQTNPLVTLGSNPSVGTSLNGFATAHFTGASSQSLSSGALTTANIFSSPGDGITLNAGTISLLFFPNSLTAPTPAIIDNPGIFCSMSGEDISITIATDGLHVSLYNAGENTPGPITCAASAWHLLQIRWDGVSIGECRLDNGSWQSLGTTKTVDSTSLAMILGTNYDSAAFFDGLIADVKTSPQCLSRAILDLDRVSYTDSRYKLTF